MFFLLLMVDKKKCVFKNKPCTSVMRRNRETIGHLITSAIRQCLERKRKKEKKTVWEYPENLGRVAGNNHEMLDASASKLSCCYKNKRIVFIHILVKDVWYFWSIWGQLSEALMPVDQQQFRESIQKHTRCLVNDWTEILIRYKRKETEVWQQTHFIVMNIKLTNAGTVNNHFTSHQLSQSLCNFWLCRPSTTYSEEATDSAMSH